MTELTQDIKSKVMTQTKQHIADAGLNWDILFVDPDALYISGDKVVDPSNSKRLHLKINNSAAVGTEDDEVYVGLTLRSGESRLENHISKTVPYSVDSIVDTYLDMMKIIFIDPKQL